VGHVRRLQIALSVPAPAASRTRSYTVCDILQSKFHDIVLPGLGLSGADKDNERFKLECLIRDVLVTRNWVAHTTLSIEEMMRGLQSLLHLLHMLPCDAAQLKCVCDVVDACILDFVRCRSSERVFQLSLNFSRGSCSSATASAFATPWAKRQKSKRPSKRWSTKWPKRKLQ